MSTITTRSGKGSPLTSSEVDSNFTSLNDDKQEILAEGAFVDGDKAKLDGIESGATADQTASEILTAIKTVDGSGSGLDADQLDGQHGSYYQNASNLNAGTVLNARLNSSLGAYTIDPSIPNGDRSSLSVPTLSMAAMVDPAIENKMQFAVPDVIEGSTDGGSTWTDITSNYSTNDLKDMMSGTGTGGGITITSQQYDKIRIYWNYSQYSYGYVYLNYLHIYQSGRSNTATIQIEKKDYTNQTWSTVDITGSHGGWPTHVWIPHDAIPFVASAGRNDSVRITYDFTWNTSNPQSFGITKINWYGTYPVAQHNRVTTWDRDGNFQVQNNLLVNGTVDGRDVASDGSKLDGIEAGADVTDTNNVTAAGALMDSEVANLAQVKAFDSSDYATAAQGTKADSALQDVVDDTTPQLGGNLNVNGNQIHLNQTSGVAIKTVGDLGNADLTLLQASSSNNSDYGFDIKYMGSRSGNANSFALEMHNQTGTHVEAITVYQDGKVGINNTTPTAPLDVTGNIVVSGTVDGRDIAADGSKLDGIESGATADQTASEILTAIKTVDGSGSGLDADTLDGIQASSFLRSDTADSASADITLTNGADLVFYDHNGTFPTASGGFYWDLNNDSARIYARQPASDQIDFFFKITDNALSTDRFVYWIDDYQGATYDKYPAQFDGTAQYLSVPVDGSGNKDLANARFKVPYSGDVVIDGNKVWHAGNDGAGSGLNADLLDGVQASNFLRSNTADSATGLIQFDGGINVLSGTGGGQLRIRRNSGSTDGDDIADIHMDDAGLIIDIDNDNDFDTGKFLVRRVTGGSFTNTLAVDADYFQYNGNEVWHAGNDGSGSGLDADKVDGYNIEVVASMPATPDPNTIYYVTG